MGKPLSDKERQLQKKLIPLNIFVCILCIIAMLSLFFTPFVKADIGKMLRSEQAMQLVGDMINDEIGGSTEGAASKGADYAPLVEGVVKNVLSTAEGSVSLTATGALKVFFAPKEERADAALQGMLTGDGALVDTLIDSIVDGVGEVFESEAGKRAVEEVMITALVYAAADSVEGITAERAAALVEIFGGIDDITDGNTAPVAAAIITELENDFTLTEADKTAIGMQLQQVYDDTKAHLGAGESVTKEAVVCVAVSETVDLSSINIANILENLIGGSGGEEEGQSLARSGGKIVTSYSELVAEIGIDESEAAKIKSDLKSSLTDMVGEGASALSVVFDNYGWLFLGIAGFMLPWLVLFLFSFIRIFTKNKRFMMWYVKLTGFIPPLVFLALALAPNILSAFAPEASPLIYALVSGLSSMTWICGICYILLWIASVLWAFPIKHQIRKERKFMKELIKNGAMPEAEPAPLGEVPADGYGLGYGTAGGFDANLYGTGYGSDYGSGYGTDFGSDYGYGSDGLDGYNPYDPDGFDDIIDDYGLGSDFDFGYGSYGSYGSYDDDEDDDDDY